MTNRREKLLADYEVRDGIIRTPGTFEGEPFWLPVLWELAMEGFADSDDGTRFQFRIPKGDPLRTEFPELDAWLGRKRTVHVFQDSQGFVYAR